MPLRTAAEKAVIHEFLSSVIDMYAFRIRRRSELLSRGECSPEQVDHCCNEVKQATIVKYELERILKDIEEGMSYE